MWERISEHKTWAGQIFGVIGGTAAAIAYGHWVLGTFVSQLVWIGIGIALLSQYGDLTASFVKRKLKIIDYSHAWADTVELLTGLTVGFILQFLQPAD